MSNFKKAILIKTYARVAIFGPSGNGKTYTSLQLSKGLANSGKIALIDTERGSSTKYSDIFDFDVLELSEFNPQNYINGINEAVGEGYSVLIIDSLSHAWEGKGGILDLHDEAIAKQKIKNSFTAWKDVTPLHRKLVDALISAPLHIIVTMRSKTEYVIDKNEYGKSQVRKLGLKPIQREGLEYEFDIVGDMSDQYSWVISKSRYAPFSGKIIPKPIPSTGEEILAWVTKGTSQENVLAEQKNEIQRLIKNRLINYEERSRINHMLTTNCSLKDLDKTINILSNWIKNRRIV